MVAQSEAGASMTQDLNLQSRNQREGRYVGKWRGVFRRSHPPFFQFGTWPGPRYDDDPHCGCKLNRKDRKRDKMDSRLYTDNF